MLRLPKLNCFSLDPCFSLSFTFLLHLMRWRSWLRHCATSQKVAGSIPDGIIGIFHWHNPSSRTMALGSTQPLTEMSRADNLATFMCRLSWNLGTSTSWNPLGLFRPVMGLLYLLLQLMYVSFIHRNTRNIVSRCPWGDGGTPKDVNVTQYSH